MVLRAFSIDLILGETEYGIERKIGGKMKKRRKIEANYNNGVYLLSVCYMEKTSTNGVWHRDS